MVADSTELTDVCGLGREPAAGNDCAPKPNHKRDAIEKASNAELLAQAFRPDPARVQASSPNHTPESLYPETLVGCSSQEATVRAEKKAPSAPPVLDPGAEDRPIGEMIDSAISLEVDIAGGMAPIEPAASPSSWESVSSNAIAPLSPVPDVGAGAPNEKHTFTIFSRERRFSEHLLLAAIFGVGLATGGGFFFTIRTFWTDLPRPHTDWSTPVALLPQLPMPSRELSPAQSETPPAQAPETRPRPATSPDPELANARSRAAEYLAQHKPELLERHTASWLVRFPTDPGLHHLRGLAFLALGKVQPALAELRRTVALAPDLAEAHLALAEAALQAHDRKSAEEALRAYALLRPDDRNPEFLRLGAELRD